MITEAQIFLTRECNLNCGYCKLTSRKLEELTFDQWKEAFKVLKDRGIKTIKIMGGEPTVKEWLPDLINYGTNLGFKIALLSNSSFSGRMLEKIKQSKLYAYFASIDCLKHLKGEKGPVKKTGDGWRMLEELKNHIPLLAANVVINRHNIRDIPQIIEQLSMGYFFANLCTVQTTSSKEKEFSNYKIKSKYVFDESDKKMLAELSDELLEMKEKGFLISVPNEYIRDIPLYGIHNNWQCNNMYQLRVDADGGIMFCNEWRTFLANRYNALTFSQEEIASFLLDWKSVRNTINCDGCYWSSLYQAEINVKNNKYEFDYVKTA